MGNDIFIRKAQLRLYGINTPEIHSRSSEEKEAGLKAKEWLKNLIEGKEVKFESLKREKYGRMLGILYFEDKNINEELVKRGLAVEYLI